MIVLHAMQGVAFVALEQQARRQLVKGPPTIHPHVNEKIQGSAALEGVDGDACWGSRRGLDPLRSACLRRALGS